MCWNLNFMCGFCFMRISGCASLTKNAGEKANYTERGCKTKGGFRITLNRNRGLFTLSEFPPSYWDS